MKPGDVLDGRFEIVARAGTGGMGEVFRAMDRAAGAPVAIKVLHAAYAADAPRFLREGGMLAQLSHPGIVRYLAQGTAPSGASYLAMEWLDGEDLGARLRRGRLGADDTITLLAGAAEALAAVHDRGIVHRDLKPSNLFLVRGEVAQVKLLDFGIAWLPEGTRMTRSGMILGTPAYMAPEQARSGSPFDARADVFALGCVLFECLTGRPAFSGAHVMDVLLKIVLEEVPRAREIAPETPPALDDLCARMVAKDPRARPRNGAAVAAAIAALGLEATLSDGSQAPSERSAAWLTRDERVVRSIVLLGHERRGARSDAETQSASVPEGMQEEAAARGARLDLLADGSILVAFAGVGLATDQAMQAARCALALRAHAGGRPMGLATGRAELTGTLPTGNLIHRALGALARAAPAVDGEPRRSAIAIDEVTAGLLDARFDVAETPEGLWLRGEQALAKGARTLLGKPTACVGRDWELTSLEALLAACFDEPRVCAALVTGPAGMGKTRVATELVRRVRQRDDSIALWIGRGDPLRAGAPLGLLGQALRDAMGIQDGEPPEARRDKIVARVRRDAGAADAQRIAEFLGELLGTPFPDEDSVQLRAARGDARLLGDQMRRAWVDFLGAASAAQPVLLVLEDLHWGDLPTVQYVDEALRCLEPRPLVVLALARPEVHELFPRLWADRDLQEIRLKSLSAKASARLVRQVLGDGVREEALESLVAQANGNAFYLEELIRAAAAGKMDALPETVLAMVQSRLEALDEPSRRLLRAASVFGRTFWRGAVEALLGAASATSTDRHLDRLEQQEWIVARAESRFQGERELYFRHDLVHEAAYGMLTEGDRALGHQLAGAWLERAAEPSAAVIAEHFDRGGVPARAVDFYAKAAAQALAANDLGAALSWTERAEALGATGEALGRALLVRAEASFRRAQHAEGFQWALSALELLPKQSPPWYGAMTLAGHASFNLNRHDQLVALADQLSGAWRDEQVSGPAVVAAAMLAVSLRLGGHHDRAEALHARVEPLLDRFLDDPSVTGFVYLEGANRALIADNFSAAFPCYERSVQCHERAGDWLEVCRLRIHLGFAHSRVGAQQEAASILRAAIADAERLGLDLFLGMGWQNLGVVLGILGAYDEARALESRAVAFFSVQGSPRWEGVCRTSLSQILLNSGAVEEAEEEARRAVELLEPAKAFQVLALAILASVLLARGRPVAALAEARRAMAALDDLGRIEEGEAYVRMVYAEALFSAGDHGAARAVIADARERLLGAAAVIDEPQWRDSFLRGVPENARTLELAAAWLGEDGP